MNRRLPAEWAPQAAVLLTWPRADGDFADALSEVVDNFTRLTLTIARFEPVWISTADDPAALRCRLLDAGVPESRLRLWQVPNDDVWTRDHGPVTVFENGAPLHLDFRFNGWGGKFPHARDDALTARLAQLGALPFPLRRVDFVLEGGAIETDGAGTLLSMQRCLFHHSRNPGLDRSRIASVLREQLGCTRLLWLTRGDLLGDDTDGHIDTLARFCDPATIAYQACDDRDDPHFAELAAMRRELEALRRADGAPYALIPLPLPRSLHDAGGRRLPAGYANFLILNGAVLLPTYTDPADAVAAERLRPAFPGREIVGVDCRALIRQSGSLHCVSMQIPSSQAVIAADG
ncbi:MAG: agmatine deiminase family protein [Gammaproteobacteria bacterium]|nr:agmatine deiminase family protein [Gammaproteobacteria bacterium]